MVKIIHKIQIFPVSNSDSVPFVGEVTSPDMLRKKFGKSFGKKRKRSRKNSFGRFKALLICKERDEHHRNMKEIN